MTADEALATKLPECCGRQSAEWDECQKSGVIHETIKLLNDGDALELFNATLFEAHFWFRFIRTAPPWQDERWMYFVGLSRRPQTHHRT